MAEKSSVIEALSIDCVIFGFMSAGLEVLLVRHGEGISQGQWALPGGWIRYDEGVDEAAARLLYDLTGVHHVYLEQFHTFGAVNRYPGKRVITIAYNALVNPEDYTLKAGFTADDVQWFNIHNLPTLPYDHHTIWKAGFAHLKQKIRHEPLGFNLLPKKFTLYQLQLLYEAILETQLDKPNFRRKMMKMNLLIPCEEKQRDVSHRAAKLYRFDKRVYENLKEQGMSFDFSF